jgi:hypothetical protein
MISHPHRLTWAPTREALTPLLRGHDAGPHPNVETRLIRLHAGLASALAASGLAQACFELNGWGVMAERRVGSSVLQTVSMKQPDVVRSKHR